MTTATFTLIINSPGTVPSDIVITPTAGLTAPVVSGTVVATVSVTKAGWIGSISCDHPGLSVGGATPNYTLIAAGSLAAQSTLVNVTVNP